jgi:hypothetical protein
VSAGAVSALPRCVSHCIPSQLDDAVKKPSITSDSQSNPAIRRVKTLSLVLF